MTLPIWQTQITDARGNVVEGADVYVYQPGTDVVVSIWADKDKNTTKSNPFQSDSEGHAFFYAEPGIYDVYAEKDGVTMRFNREPLIDPAVAALDPTGKSVGQVPVVRSGSSLPIEFLQSNDLGDVEYPSALSNGDMLVWNNSLGRWQNEALLDGTGITINVDNNGQLSVVLDAVINELNDVNELNVKAAGQLLIWDVTAAEWQNATLTGGNAISVQNADGSVTLGVSAGGITTNELDLSIAPTWTSTHTFNAGLDAGSSKINSLANGVADSDAVNKGQLDSVNRGRIRKVAVKAATDGANVDLTSSIDPNPIDGYTLSDGDRILLKDQTTGTENGIYDAVTATDPTTWVRSDDADEDSEVQAGISFVCLNGTVNGDREFVQDTEDPVLGTDTLVFSGYSLGAVDAGNGLVKTGSTMEIDTGIVAVVDQVNTFYANQIISATAPAGAFLGTLTFQWNDNPIVFITAEAGDDGTNEDEGDLRIQTSNGGSPGERLRIHQEGGIVVGGNGGLPGGPQQGHGTLRADNGLYDGDNRVARQPTGSSDPGLAFDTWRTPNSTFAVSVVLDVSVASDGSNDGQIRLEVDNSGGTSRDYLLLANKDADDSSSASQSREILSTIIPPGGSYRISNLSDPAGANTIVTHQEIVF